MERWRGNKRTGGMSGLQSAEAEAEAEAEEITKKARARFTADHKVCASFCSDSIFYINRVADHSNK
jgi:hypothetical protein